ncbi:MAG: histidine kinase dimerization/phosphoacceptor domain -containing protein, partial [Cyanobacteria bacterium P01_F01_bin.4]
MDNQSSDFETQYQTALRAYLRAYLRGVTQPSQGVLQRLSEIAQRQQLRASDWVRVHHQTQQQLSWSGSTDDGEITHQASLFLQRCLEFWEQPSVMAKGEIIGHDLFVDITAGQRAELARERQAQQFQNLVDNVPGIIYRCVAAPGFPIEFISGEITTMTGYPSENFTQMGFRLLDEITYPDDQLMVQATIDQAVQNDEPYQVEYRIVTASGKPRWVLERGRSTWDSQTKLHHIDGLIIDINDLKLAEAQVKASLAEKDVLLREVHHRVKNNLNVVHSLLEMQSRQAQSSELKKLLADSQQRLQVMARIHEQLYRSDQLAQINFADYIVGLVRNVDSMVRSAGNQVQLQLKLEPVWFTLETAIPIGLILNELLTNALKYAFPGDQSGVVDIILERQGQNLHLAVYDNGVGLPDPFQIERQSS